MRALGADLEVVPSPEGIHPWLIREVMARAEDIAKHEDAYPTDQFNNRDMVVGYREMGEEIVAQIDGDIDAFCTYIGTAGCSLGVTQVLGDHHPDVLRVGIEPGESAVLSGGQPGTHRIEGGGVLFVPPLLSTSDLDRIETVSTDDAMAMAREAARTEGIFSGPSTGANLVVALRLAAELGPGRRIVTVQCDSGLKYLAGDLYRSGDS